MAESKVDVHGAKCIHVTVTPEGKQKCNKSALQTTNSVNHGWLCGKHYTAVKNNWKGK